MSKYKPYEGLESNMQISISSFLDYNNILWMHCPNEIKAKPQYMKKRKKLGVKSGFPDIAIFNKTKHYNGLFIEIKNKKGKLSENQIKWLQNLNKQGYLAVWSNSLDECIDIILKYIDGHEFNIKQNYRVIWE